MPSTQSYKLLTHVARMNLPISAALTVMWTACIMFSGPGCDQAGRQSVSQSADQDKLIVLTTSQPLLEMARYIGGQDIEVLSAIPAEQTSRNWKPAMAGIRLLQSASLVLINGAGYEPWKNRVSLPESRIVDTASGYYEQLIRVPDFVIHQHGPDGRHSHAGTVWATWLDPELAMSQLQQVSAALQRISSTHSRQIAQRTNKLLQELRALDADIDLLAKQNRPDGFTILGDGPYYQYLARRLNWQLEYVHWSDPERHVVENDAAGLSAAELQELRDAAVRSTAGLFLMASSRPVAAVKFAESIGLRVVSIDLCERMSDTDHSFIARLRENLKRLSAAIEAQRDNPSE